MRGKRRQAQFTQDNTRITPADAGKTAGLEGVVLIGQDHPRGCGENATAKNSSARGSGSPPRMRGKLFTSHALRRLPGITPADAGKTLQIITFYPKKQDHPRGCGENVNALAHHIPSIGSPPRMRGKPRHKKSRTVTSRITPADAGKTWFLQLQIHTI